MWLELSLEMGIPLQLLRRQMSSTDFLKYQRFLTERQNRKKPIHWYLAQIALEVRRSAHPKTKTKLDDYILSFGKTEEKPASKESIVQRSKNFWFAHVFRKKSDK